MARGEQVGGELQLSTCPLVQRQELAFLRQSYDPHWPARGSITRRACSQPTSSTLGNLVSSVDATRFNDGDDPDQASTWAARWLDELLQAKGWDIAKLARESGLSERTLQDVRRRQAKRSPHRRTLEAIAGAFGVTTPSPPSAPNPASEPQRSLTYTSLDYMDGLLSTVLQYTRGPRAFGRHHLRGLLLPSVDTEFNAETLTRLYGSDDWHVWFATEDDERTMVRSLILAPIASEEDTADDQLGYRVLLNLARKFAIRRKMSHEYYYAIWSQLHSHYRKAIEAGNDDAWPVTRDFIKLLQGSPDPLWQLGARVIVNKLAVWLEANRRTPSDYGMEYSDPPLTDQQRNPLLLRRRPEWGYTLLMEHMLCHAYDAHAHRWMLAREKGRDSTETIQAIRNCIDEAERLREGYTPPIWWNLRLWYAEALTSSDLARDKNRGEIYRADLENFAIRHNWKWKRRRAQISARGARI